MNTSINDKVPSKDATADYSDEAIPAALDFSIPNYASAMATTAEIVNSLSSPR